jgi:amino acid adenylation domain-containing protein
MYTREDEGRMIEASYPLSPLQQGMLFDSLYAPGSGVDVEQMVIGLRERLDVPALTRAWLRVVERHPTLRTAFRWEGTDAPRQDVHARVELPVEPRDWRELSAAEREDRFDAFLKADRARGVDLASPPLMRLALFRTGGEEHRLVWTFHHALLDGRAMTLVLREVFAFYEAFRDGREIDLPLPPPYADYIAWLDARDPAPDRAFWAGVLDGFTVSTPLPRRGAHAAPDGGEAYAEQETVLPAATASALRTLAHAHGLTLNAIVQGAWAILLSRYSGERDVVFGTVRACRHGCVEGAAAMVGLFINTVPMRLAVPPDAPVLALLGQARAQGVAVRPHEHAPLAEIQGWSGIPQGTPLFESTLNFQSAPFYQSLLAQGEGWSGRSFRIHRQPSTPLTLAVYGEPVLLARIGYDTRAFEPQVIAGMLRHLGVLLEAIGADAARPAAALPLLTEAERRRVLVEWNDTAAPHPADACLHAMFTGQARRTPGGTALVHDGRRVTYAELDEAANRLAHALRARGVGPEARVGICLERAPELVAALLGVLKAGGACVPLDPAYPRERLLYMLRDSGARVLVTRDALRAALAESGAEALCLDTDAAELRAGSGAPPPDGAAPANLAYVIYTSGSTGRPKGVAVTHASAAALVHWAHDVFAPRELEGVLASTSVCFDLSVFELFVPLCGGGRAVLAGNALELREMADADEVRLLNTVPSAAAALLDAGGLPPGVETVCLAGEPLATELVDRLYAQPGVRRVYDLYGPSEDTTYSTFTLRRAGAAPTIGRPVANTRAYVLGPDLRPVPAGVPGELYLGGAGLARGYLGRPGLTAERFVPDPFAAGPGGRLYRTGDRVRWTADGVLEYRGRLDHQVKIRGFRVEPGEVEAALRRAPGVAQAVVAVREDGGEKRLAAYVGAAPGARPAAEELREALGTVLPEHMVPSAFVFLDALPLTPNGKVDRAALPDPGGAGAGRGAYAPPRTPVEEVVAGIWAEVLREERVGVHDHFFALGGHSLRAAQVVSRLRAALDVEVPLRTLFAAPRLEELARQVERIRAAAAGPAAPPIRPLPPERRAAGVPLSFAQQRLWFLHEMEPDGSTYNILTALRLRGELRVDALAHALGEVVRRHEALRTRFVARGGTPLQAVAPPAPAALVPEPVPADGVERTVAGEARRVFALGEGPPFVARLLRVDADDHVLLLSMHHIVGDAWSRGILLRELAAHYAAFGADAPPPLAQPPVQYADFAVWQREWLRGEALERPLAWWTARLAGAPAVLELPADRPRAPVRGTRGARRTAVLPAGAAAGLRALGRREGATLFMVLLSGFQLLLSRYAGQDDLVVGTPVAGRTRAETEGLIGCFVNTLAMRADLSGDPPFRALLARTREAALEAYAHQELPFERLVEALGVERSLAHTPLFQAVFALQNTPAGEHAFPGLRMSAMEVGYETAKFDLYLAAEEHGGELRLALEYATELFDAATAGRMLDHLEVLLRGIADDPGRRLSQLPLLGAAERRRVLEEWNATARDYPAGACVHELFEAQAARTPDAEALLYGGGRLAYGALNARANRLAHHLRARGVGPEARVGICLERTPELVVALLAVLKAGGAYVPLDPAYPRQRIGWMLEDAEVRLVLTRGALAERLPPGAAEALCLDALDGLEGLPDDNPRSGAAPGNLSHVIFTSGSTGRPKGVMIRHAATAVLLHWMREAVTDEERARVLFSTSINFDVSVAELFGTLCWGGALVLVENALELARLPAGAGITYASMVPTAAAELLRTGGIPASVRTLALGGEALPPALAQALYATGTVRRVANLYGPTEDTTYSTCAEVPRGEGRVVVGRPVANTRAYVLDRALNPVPVGVPGEVYLAGDGLARGYAGRPGLTAERFLPDPYGAPGSRMYRVWDRVRWTPEGELDYLGRTDFQVKVRGFRIEPGEVEAALLREPEVREAVVVARGEEGERRLVAYVVPREGHGGAARALRARLAERVPGYMVPSAVVELPALPLTPNGKLDRAALPEPDGAPEGAPAYAPPCTPAQEALAAIWAEVLGRARVGIHDNFFDLGGHSLLAARAHARIRDALGRDLPIGLLFQHQTIGDLADALERVPDARAGDDAPGGWDDTLITRLSEEDLDLLLDTLAEGAAFDE